MEKTEKIMETFVKESRVLTSAHIHQKITLFCILTDAVYIIHYEALIQDSQSSVRR